jgi:hypothetical protein
MITYAETLSLDAEIQRLKQEQQAKLEPESSGSFGSGVAASPAAPASPPPEVQSAPVTTDPAAGQLATSPSVKKFGNISPKCELCGKSVYHAEKYMDSGKIYHTQYVFPTCS